MNPLIYTEMKKICCVVGKSVLIRNTTFTKGKLTRNLKFKVVNIPRHAPLVILICMGLKVKSSESK